MADNKIQEFVRKGSRASELKSFYDKKTVQHAYNFFVTIINDDRSNITRSTTNDSSRLTNFDEMPLLETWHIRNIALQNYDFKREIQKHGVLPRSFPVLEFDGFEVRIEFEEDDRGTIAYFVNWLQRRIINEKGIYRNPGLNKIDRIIVDVKDELGNRITSYAFLDAYFLKADPPTYDYTSSDTVKIGITFGADSFIQDFERYTEGDNQSPLNTRTNTGSGTFFNR